jgi:predicted nucleic acid-binding protein
VQPCNVELDVAIPLEVENECCSVKKSLDALMIRKALDESRTRVIAVAVKHRKFITKVEEDFGLGRGEAEAIVLALAAKARVLGIDHKNGINACKLLGVAFTTVVGILVRMCEKRLLTKSELSRNLRGCERNVIFLLRCVPWPLPRPALLRFPVLLALGMLA